MNEEGWYTDPYGLHDARWMSQGRPTGLVRDGDIEATEEVPDGPPTSTPQRISALDSDGLSTSDVIREATGKTPSYQDAAEESIDSSW